MAYYTKKGGKKKYNLGIFIFDVILVSMTKGLWTIWVILRCIFNR